MVIAAILALVKKGANVIAKWRPGEEAGRQMPNALSGREAALAEIVRQLDEIEVRPLNDPEIKLIESEVVRAFATKLKAAVKAEQVSESDLIGIVGPLD